MVGPNGAGAQFEQANTAERLSEYLVATTDPEKSYTDAIERLESQAGCSQSVDGRPTSSTFQQVISVPAYGDRRVGMLERDEAGGVISQVGYVVVRDGRYVLIVGYGGGGRLESQALDQLTDQALAKVTGSAGNQ